MEPIEKKYNVIIEKSKNKKNQYIVKNFNNENIFKILLEIFQQKINKIEIDFQNEMDKNIIGFNKENNKIFLYVVLVFLQIKEEDLNLIENYVKNNTMFLIDLSNNGMLYPNKTFQKFEEFKNFVLSLQ